MSVRVPVHPGLFVEGPPARLLGSRCPSCGARHFPVHQTCPYCSADGAEPTELAGTGHLWSWTAVTAPPPGYIGQVPYGFGVVELDGIRVLGRLTEPDPAMLHAGQPMELVTDVLGPDGDGRDVVTYAFRARAEG